MTRLVQLVITEFWEGQNEDEKRSLPMIKIVPLFSSFIEKYLANEDFRIESYSVVQG